jgi:hypothetical protein
MTMNTGTIRTLALGVAAAGMLVLANPASAQAGCTRAELQELAGKVVDAHKQGDTLLIPRGNWTSYRENFKLGSMISGIISQGLDVKWHRALLDTAACRISLEMVVLEPKPYVIASQIDIRGGAVNQISSIITDQDDWLFDAQMTYEYARREDWSPIPVERQNTRAELKAAADAYLDLFKDKNVAVPWGTPCNRLEGGIYTGKGTPEDSCNVGVPEGVDLIERSYVIDQDLGAVDVFLEFGTRQRPDSHRFRIENGRLRYVHTVTDCVDQVNCGFSPMSEMRIRNPGMQPDPALFDK